VREEIRSMTPDEAKKKLHDLLVQQTPNWTFEAGKFGYSPLLIGLYMSELIPRIDPKHRPLRQFMMVSLCFITPLPNTVPR
jgi:hypothetical protein